MLPNILQCRLGKRWPVSFFIEKNHILCFSAENSPENCLAVALTLTHLAWMRRQTANWVLKSGAQSRFQSYPKSQSIPCQGTPRPASRPPPPPLIAHTKCSCRHACLFQKTSFMFLLLMSANGFIMCPLSSNPTTVMKGQAWSQHMGLSSKPKSL